MAADPSQRDTSVSWPIPAAVMAAVLGGLFLYQTPLKSSRPAGTGLEKSESLGEASVQARLWQDPLAAVEEHAQAESKRGKTIELRVVNGKLTAIEKGTSTGNHHKNLKDSEWKKKSDVTVLLVMTRGSPYIEGTEWRIRSRYAVSSALGVACFVPEDSEHIFYFDWQPNNKEKSTIKVPYEWHRGRKLRRCKEDNNDRKVLVLWLKEEVFAGSPVETLLKLAKDVESKITNRKKIEFKVIGPSSSLILRDMLEEAISKDKEKKKNTSLDIYSPWATASLGYLGFSVDLSKYRDVTMENAQGEKYSWVKSTADRAFKDDDVQFHHRIGTDDELAIALVEELKRRGIDVGKDHIAIISEWDTIYSRALFQEFSAVVYCFSKKLRRPDESCMNEAYDFLVYRPITTHDKLPQIHRYSYLRGLDGEIPGEMTEYGDKKKADRDKQKTEGNKDRQADFDYLERPDGQSQLDYVRRLADKIEALADDKWHDGSEFKAIGVLGSDAYDKLLILQALRKRFPKAIFFTTDLDARLFHPSQYEWTRNLIIASHFGLQLHDAIQRDVPPFRDSYQTSAFFAVLKALSHIRQGENKEVYEVDLAPCTFSIENSPRLYEVGRTKAVDLSIEPNAKTNSSSSLCIKGNTIPQSIHTPRPLPPGKRSFGLA